VTDGVGEVLAVPLALVDEMVAHAAATRPREACGVLAGPCGQRRGDQVVRMRNVGHGVDRYEFDPVVQLELWRELEAAGRRVWAIYHSHPTTGAYPSRVDIATATYPDLHYVILGADGRIGAWQIRDGRVVGGSSIAV